jgi:hypothetical protein
MWDIFRARSDASRLRSPEGDEGADGKRWMIIANDVLDEQKAMPTNGLKISDGTNRW